MLLSKSLPLTLLLLIANVSPSSGKLLPHAIHKAHKAAVRQTHSLARDLRTAFGAVLVSSPQTHLNSRDVNNKVVYCKGGNINPGANTTPTGGSPSGNSTTTRGGSSTARTRTSTGANPSATVPASSPWKLTEGYVSTMNLIGEGRLPTIYVIGRNKFLRGLVFLHWCRSYKWLVVRCLSLNQPSKVMTRGCTIC